MNCQHLFRTGRIHRHRFVQFDCADASTPLQSATRARMIHQNLPHETSANAKKMRTVLPCHSLLIDKPQVRFVKERGRLQQVVWNFAVHVARSQPAQFVIDQRDQLVQSNTVSFAPIQQELRNFRRSSAFLASQNIRSISNYFYTKAPRRLNLDRTLIPYRTNVLTIATRSLPACGRQPLLAAAIRARADVIVTVNLRDFPSKALAPLAIEAQHPDEFVQHLLELSPGLVVKAVQDHRQSLKNPAMSVDTYLTTMERQGLTQTVSMLREYMF